MSFVFKLLGTIDITGNVFNVPKVTVSSRDQFKYFSFSPSGLRVFTKPDAAAGFSNNTYLTIERSGQVIWSGYLDHPLGFSDPGKNRLVTSRFVSETQRLKEILFTHSGEISITAILNAAVSKINTVFSGYSWSGSHISQDLQIKSLYRPRSAITGQLRPNGMFTTVDPFFTDSAIPDRLYLEDAANIGTYYHLEDGLLKTTPPIGGFTQVAQSSQDIPFIGTVDGVDFPNASFGEGKFYLLPEGVIPGAYLPYAYGIWRPVTGITTWDYADNPVTDIFLDVCKLSDSIFTVLNKEIRFTNNQSGNTYNLNLEEFENRLSYRKYFEFDGLNLAMDTSTYNDFGSFPSLEYYYQNKFKGNVEVREIHFLTTQNFEVGYYLTNNGNNYGRIVSVEYEANSKLVKLKTEKGEDD